MSNLIEWYNSMINSNRVLPEGDTEQRNPWAIIDYSPAPHALFTTFMHLPLILWSNSDSFLRSSSPYWIPSLSPDRLLSSLGAAAVDGGSLLIFWFVLALEALFCLSKYTF